MSQTTKTQTTQDPSFYPDIFTEFRQVLLWPEMQILAVMLIFFLYLQFANKGDKLADARWANQAAISRAKRKAKQQVKQPQLGKGVALYLGSVNKYPVPDAQKHIAVIGVTDSGKTTSAIDQLIRSALEQGFSAFVYDIKAEQMRKHAAYALSLGYQLSCFSPGRLWSGCSDPMRFLRDEYDSTSARQIAECISRNLVSSDKKDSFFGPATDSLIETVLLIAKEFCPDFMMAWAILSLPNLARRLKCAKDHHHLNLWTTIAATTTISVAEAERTVAGIVAGATNAFRAFISRDLLPSISGTSTIPLQVDGKHIIFFQVDEERKDVTGPLCSMMFRMHMIANLNNQFKRKSPLCLFIDECTSANFVDIDIDLNLRRSYGLIAVLGYQGRSQLIDRYGQYKAASIDTGTVTKMIFKTIDPEHQQLLSKSLGDKQVKIRTRSYGASGRSTSENIQRTALCEPNRFGQMDQGELIMINNGFKAWKRASLPWHIPQVKISPETFDLENHCCIKYDKIIHDKMIQREQATGLKLDNHTLELELLDRMAYADMILPDQPELDAFQAAQTEQPHAV